MIQTVRTSNSIQLYFILIEGQKNEESSSVDMKEAYEDAKNWSLDTVWINESEVLKIDNQIKGQVFVFPQFGGDIFNAFIESHRNCRVVGPRCLLFCFLHQIPIPNTPFPIYFMAMDGLRVCVDVVPKEEKERLWKLISYMGGRIDRNLTVSTTHLVVDNVLSEPCFIAYEHGKKVVKRTWIEDIWEKNKLDDLEANNDETIKSHLCPIFYNLQITASNLNETQKISLQKIINANGGNFTREMTRATDILIIPRGEGEKFKYSKRWNAKCIHPDWIEKCIEKGYAVRYNQFLIKDGENTNSTPVKSCIPRMSNLLDSNDSDISAIPSCDSKTLIGDSALESQATGGHKISAPNAFKTPVKSGSSNTFDISYQKILDSIVLNEIKKCGALLDGCKVFLMGFNNNEEEKLRRILNYGGAIRFTELNESVTHIIVGKVNKTELENLQNLPYKPHVVTVKWLSDSIKKSNLEKELNYSCLIANEKEVSGSSHRALQPSPLSKKGLQMLDPVKKVHTDLHIPVVDQKLLSEYTHLRNAGPSETTDHGKKVSEVNRELKVSRETSPNRDSSVDKMFKGLRFSIVGHTPSVSDGIKQAILKFSGMVVPLGSHSVVDYTVVPLLNTKRIICKNEIITSIWVEECLHHKKVLDVKYYHRPISVPECTSIDLFKDCVITFSAYDLFEKQYLGDMAAWLGATCQDVLSKKHNPEKNIAKTTHLVCSSDKGAKVTAAKKWNLPIVREQWLLDCFSQRKMLPVEGYSANQLNPVPISAVPSTFKNCDPSEKYDANAAAKVDGKIIAKSSKSDSACPGSSKTDNHQPVYQCELLDIKTPSSNISTDDTPNVQKRKFSKLSDRVTEVKRLNQATPALMNAVNGAMEKKTSGYGYSKLIAATKTKDLPTGLLAKINSETMGNSKRRKNHSSPTSDGDDVRIDSPKIKLLRVDSEITMASQEVGWHDTLNDITPIENAPAGTSAEIHNMMISVPDNKRKTQCENIIKTLGGKVLTSYEPNREKSEQVTHLIIDELKKTEKLLCSISSGLWVLHSSYLLECQKQGKFVDEEEFEWGNPNSRNLPIKDSKDYMLIAKSAHRWRKLIQKEGLSKRPFVSMKATIFTSPNNEMKNSLARVIKSGGGIVLPPSEILNSTHCLFKSANNLNDISEKLHELAKRKVHCLLAVYLSDYLMYDPPPKPEDVYIEEYKRLLT